MRIALVSRAWWPFVKGGAEKFIDRVSIELSKRGHEIYVVTRFKPIDQNRKLIYVETGMKLPVLSSYIFSRRAAEKINELRPDAVIINGYWGEVSPAYISREIPVFLVIHDVGLFTSPRSKRSPIRYLLRREALKRSTKRSDVIIVPTEIVKRDLIKFLSADPSKIYVLGSEGVDAPMGFEHEENEYIDILHLARFSPNKAQEVSLRAIEILAKQIPNVRLWLVGGSGVDREEINYMKRVVSEAERINRLFNREVVKIEIDVDDVSRYYRIADLCIAPSVAEEGYGLTVVECMGYGKIVIASDIFRETGVATEERAYIVKRGDPVDLANTIKYAIENKEMSREKSLRALEYVRNNCRWEIVAEKIEGILKIYFNRNRS